MYLRIFFSILQFLCLMLRKKKRDRSVYVTLVKIEKHFVTNKFKQSWKIQQRSVSELGIPRTPLMWELVYIQQYFTNYCPLARPGQRRDYKRLLCVRELFPERGQTSSSGFAVYFIENLATAEANVPCQQG